MRCVVKTGAQLSGGIAEEFEAELIGESAITTPAASADLVIGNRVSKQVPFLRLLVRLSADEFDIRLSAKLDFYASKVSHCFLPVDKGS